MKNILKFLDALPNAFLIYLNCLFKNQLTKQESRISAERPNTSLHYLANRRKILPKKYYTHYSPPLDSIIYWFLQKSINLYGEALIKTFAYEKTGFGATDTGVVIVKDFWKQKGLDENELNIYDGSGLSPLNRVTTHAQVEILKYAKQRPWFSYFFNALPEYNSMKMKSGSISDVKGFCGYHTSGRWNSIHLFFSCKQLQRIVISACQ